MRVGRTESEEQTLGRKLKKMTPANSEEMVVIESLGFGRYNLQLLGDTTADVISRSNDLMRKVRSPGTERCTAAKAQAQQTVRDNREYVVEAIIGERGVIAHKTKEYKIKWKDFSEASWVTSTAVDKKCQPWLDYKRQKKEQCNSVASIATLAADLLALPADEMIQQICDEAGIQMADVMFIYAGVPCETYSIAGRTNKNRDLHKTAHGYNSRNTDAERTPCCTEDVECRHADKARLHDRIVQHVLHALKAGYDQGFNFHFGIENPDGDLKHRPFMLPEEWPEGLPRAYRPFHCCAFKHPAKKPMSFWTSMVDYFPAGTTGDGLCHNGECNMGTWNTATQMFNHAIKIARHPADGFRGIGAARQKNAMPEAWTEEFLQHAMKSRPQRTVIDLCAGWQSMRPICEKLGLNYIAVDIEGDRNIPKAQRNHITKTM